MKKLLLVASAVFSGAIGFAGCSELGDSQAKVFGVPIATIQQTVDRDEYEMGQFRLARLCESGFTVPGHSMSACVAAYGGAYQHGDYKQALHYATVGCLRDNDELQCRKATALALQTNIYGPRNSLVAPQMTAAADRQDHR